MVIEIVCVPASVVPWMYWPPSVVEYVLALGCYFACLLFAAYISSTATKALNDTSQLTTKSLQYFTITCVYEIDTYWCSY